MKDSITDEVKGSQRIDKRTSKQRLATDREHEEAPRIRNGDLKKWIVDEVKESQRVGRHTFN